MYIDTQGSSHPRDGDEHVVPCGPRTRAIAVPLKGCSERASQSGTTLERNAAASMPPFAAAAAAAIMAASRSARQAQPQLRKMPRHARPPHSTHSRPSFLPLSTSLLSRLIGLLSEDARLRSTETEAE